MANATPSITCRKAAVFSDIHANIHAFRTCYADALRHGADCFLFLGDYVSDLADSRAVLDLVYEIRGQHSTICLRGNRERYMLEYAAGRSDFSPGSRTGSLLYTFRQLERRDLAFFESLSSHNTIHLNGIPIQIAHALPTDDRFYFDTEDGGLETAFAQMEQPLLLTGHAHKQYIRSRQGKTVLNPGSIGVPRGCGYLTQYALLEWHNGQFTPQLRQLPYDIRGTIHRQFESGLTELAPHWAVGVLYDIITGEEWTLPMLERVLLANPDRSADETLWHEIATQMGMEFTEEAICRRIPNP